MTPRAADVSFQIPPLVEVSISVQLQPLNNFHMGLIGLIQEEFRDSDPIVKHDNPLEHKVEKIGVIERAEAPKFRFVKQLSCLEPSLDLKIQNACFKYKKIDSF